MIEKTLYDSSRLRPFLITASLYITAFELLKKSINKRIEEFFMVGIVCKNYNHKKEYDNEMKPYREKHKDKKDKKTYASLDWLINMKAITEADVIAYDCVRETRNKIAHELLDLINVDLSENLELISKHFVVMFELLKKIETYWVLNVVIPCNPDYDGKEFKAEEVIPGPIWAMQMLVSEAMGFTEKGTCEKS